MDSFQPYLLPPGLSDPESATRSRARRRMQAPWRNAEVKFCSRLESIEANVTSILAMVQDIHQSSALSSVDETRRRMERLEALYVCSQPSVDEVLEKMLAPVSSAPYPVFDISTASMSSATSITDHNENSNEELVYSNHFEDSASSTDAINHEDINCIGDWRAMPNEGWLKIHGIFKKHRGVQMENLRANDEVQVVHQVRSADGRYILCVGEVYTFLELKGDHAKLKYVYEDGMTVLLEVRQQDLACFELQGDRFDAQQLSGFGRAACGVQYITPHNLTSE